MELFLQPLSSWTYNLNPETKLEGDVAVVGGGSTAMDAARSALRAGARSVHILYRRTRVEMPAQAEEVRAAIAEGIELQELVAPVQILSSEGHVKGVRCQRMVLSEPDEKGRRKPVPVLGTEFDIPIDIVLVAIGEAPDPSFLPEGTSVGVAPWGGLLINPIPWPLVLQESLPQVMSPTGRSRLFMLQHTVGLLQSLFTPI